MKKVIFSVLMMLMLCFSAQSQIPAGVPVGTGNNTSQSLPFNPYNQYSYAQSIYLATEINATGTITSLSWYFAGTGNLANSQQLVIYLGTTTKSVFASSTDWEPVSNLTQVYSGGITTGSAPGWITIPISNFAYDGTSNLIVAVDENQAGSDGFDDRFYNSAVTGKRSIYINSNTGNPDPASPPTATNIAAYVPNVVFGGLVQACVTPTGLSSSAIGTTTATVSWTSTGGHPTGGSDYYYSTSNVPPTLSTVPQGNVGGTSVGLTGLNPGTTYYFWVRNNCDTDVSSWSDLTSFVTACEAVTEFNENFDAVTTPNLPTCWSQILRSSGGGISANAKVDTVPVDFYSSPNSLRLFNSGSQGEYDVIAVSPQVSNLGAKTHRLRFFAKGSNSIEIGTLDTNTNTATFNVVQTISTLTTNYTQYTVDFSTYEGTGQYIGIRLNADPQSTVNIDNVVWEPKPLCPDVTEVKVAVVSYNSATIGWTESGVEDSWDIAIGSETDTDPTLLPYGNTETSGIYVAGGLDPTTKYNVWVRSVCANGKGAYIGPVAFTTTCEPIDAFFENFDSIHIVSNPGGGSIVSEEIPYCWSKIIRANSGALVGQTDIVTSQSSVIMPSDSVNCLVMQNKGSTGNFDLILVSPPVSSLQLKNHRLKFFTKYNGSIEIGTLNSNTNAAVFTLFKSVITTNGLMEYIVDFSTYTGTDSYIGFRLPNSAGTFGAFTMDNITWEKIPLCPEISNITVPETTTSTAVVSWSPSVTGIEFSWDVAWGDMSATNPDLLSSKSVSASLPTTVTIDELNPGTSYKVWVRANCGEIKGDGAWIGPVIFNTECSPIETFFENFDSVSIASGYITESLPPCWTKIFRGVDLAQNSYINTTNANTATFPNFTLPNSVKVSPQGSDTNADVILVSPNVSTLGQAYRLKFDSFYNGTIEIGVLDGNTNAAEFTVFKTVNLDFYGNKTVVDFTGYSGAIREYNHIGIRVVPNSLTLPIINIDNIIWEPVPTCPDINTKTNVSMTTPTTALVKWQKQSTETGWEVSVHPNNPDATDAIHYTVNDPSPTTQLVEGLTADTTYYVWVRTVCGTDHGSWSAATNFGTPCLAVDIPYAEDFQTVITPAIPECTDTSVADITQGSHWQTSPSANPYGFNSTNIRCLDSDTATNAWFFTRGVNLVEETTYRISYLKGTSAPITGGCDVGNCGPINLKVLFGSSPTVDGMSNMLRDYPGLTGPAASDYVDFTVPSSGVYYFAFQNYSDAKHGDLSVDNILINDASLGNESFDLSQFNYYPNPVYDVLHISHAEKIIAVAVYNMLGQQVISNPVDGQFAKIDMSGLTNGTYMVKVSTGSYCKIIKVLKR